MLLREQSKNLTVELSLSPTTSVRIVVFTKSWSATNYSHRTDFASRGGTVGGKEQDDPKSDKGVFQYSGGFQLTDRTLTGGYINCRLQGHARQIKFEND
jgi:hypothetical protein